MDRKFLHDRALTADWCREMGLVAQAKQCDRCNQPLAWDNSPPHDKFGRFRCRRRKCRNYDKSISASKGSWFENVKVEADKAIILMYSFARGWTYDQTINETTLTAESTSRETVSDWYSYMREVCVVALETKHADDGPMMGTIEIDESLIGKQKNGVGRIPPGTWVFGMYNRTTEELRMVRCPDNKRDRETLLPIIIANIAVGSTIISDQWPVYWDNKNKRSNLTNAGYHHHTVNHSENFVDPESGANTQTIECYWRHLKTKMRSGGIPYENKADHICEFIYRHECKEKGIDVFEQLLRDIKVQFPV